MRMIEKVLNIIRRNPCKECMYYAPENNTCQSKKCASNNPYVTFTDRLYCEPAKPEGEENGTD